MKKTTKRLLSLAMAMLLLLPFAAPALASTPVVFTQAVPPHDWCGTNANVTVENNVLMGGTAFNNILRYRFSGTAATANAFSLHNLGGRFTTLTGWIGRIDGSNMVNATISFYGDNVLLASFAVNATDLPRHVSVNVTGRNLLRIEVRQTSGANNTVVQYAFADGRLTPAPVEIPPTGVSIAGAATRNMNPGQTLQLTATVTPANATNRTVTWTSSNTAVATVNANGLVTAVAAGTTTITARTATGNHTATVTIQVQAPGNDFVDSLIVVFSTIWGWFMSFINIFVVLFNAIFR